MPGAISHPRTAEAGAGTARKPTAGHGATSGYRASCAALAGPVGMRVYATVRVVLRYVRRPAAMAMHEHAGPVGQRRVGQCRVSPPRPKAAHANRAFQVRYVRRAGPEVMAQVQPLAVLVGNAADVLS